MSTNASKIYSAVLLPVYLKRFTSSVRYRLQVWNSSLRFWAVSRKKRDRIWNSKKQGFYKEKLKVKVLLEKVEKLLNVRVAKQTIYIG
jgi:hypothetical protein